MFASVIGIIYYVVAVGMLAVALLIEAGHDA